MHLRQQRFFIDHFAISQSETLQRIAPKHADDRSGTLFKKLTDKLMLLASKVTKEDLDEQVSKLLPIRTLNEIGVLRRREIEARILMPVLGRLGAEFGEERVFAIARDVIIEVAREQGRELARQMGGDGLDRFAAALEDWKKGDAYQMDTLESTPERLSFNVTRCRYAEMYGSLGIGIPVVERNTLRRPRPNPSSAVLKNAIGDA